MPGPRSGSFEVTPCDSRDSPVPAAVRTGGLGPPRPLGSGCCSGTFGGVLDASSAHRSLLTPSLSSLEIVSPSWPVAFAEAILRILKVAWCSVSLTVVIAAVGMHPAVRSVHPAIWPSGADDTRLPKVPCLSDLAALVFSRTNDFRHFEAIAAGAEALRSAARRRGWSMFHAENRAVFAPEILSRLRVVVWQNASGAPLDEVQGELFEIGRRTAEASSQPTRHSITLTLRGPSPQPPPCSCQLGAGRPPFCL